MSTSLQFPMRLCWKCFKQNPSSADICSSCGLRFENLDNYVEEVNNEYERLRKELEKGLEKREEGRETRVNIDLWPIVDFSYRIKNNISDEKKKLYRFLVIFMFASQNKIDLGQNKQEISKRLKAIFNLKASKYSKLLERQSNEVIGSLNKLVGEGSQASFSPISESIKVRRFNAKILDNLPELSEMLRDFAIDVDEYDAHLSHEATHAYISQKTEFNNNLKPSLRAIDEAACNVITEIYFPQFFDFPSGKPSKEKSFISLDLNSYKPKGIPKSLLISCINAFREYKKGLNGSKNQKVDKIRKRAVKAIEEVQNKEITPQKAIIGEYSKEEFKILRDIEIAEYRSFHALLKLGMIEPQKFSRVVHDIENQSNPYNIDVYLPDDEDNDEDNKPLLENVDTENLIQKDDLQRMEEARRELLDMGRNVEGSISDRLEKLANDIKVFVKGIKDEEIYLEHPFCPECGGIVNPEKDACTNCGSEVKPKNRKEFEEGIEYLQNELQTGHHSLYGDETEKAYLADVIGTFRTLINLALNHNRRMLKILERLHSEENKLSKFLSDYQGKKSDIEKLRRETEEEYKIAKRMLENLNKADESLKRANNRLEKFNN